uniref:Uncharacterized protein n=1 Tax=Anguilla anguilla TaxID=7936 RepID=A0A0E9X7E5_ANGAN
MVPFGIMGIPNTMICRHLSLISKDFNLLCRSGDVSHDQSFSHFNYSLFIAITLHPLPQTVQMAKVQMPRTS